DIAPAAQEDAGDADNTHGDDDPTERRIAALERLRGETGDPQAQQTSGSDGLQHDTPREECYFVATSASNLAHVRGYGHTGAVAPARMREIRNNTVPTSIGQRAVLAMR